ncbi:MAG: rhomboid family intramembrane serine protease [Clostridiales bacterium]|nr:rhomboid family intramembrane serine protease [Clostridiales bacterium]
MNITDILTAFSKGLAEKNYSFIKTKPEENLISEETTELCFYKPSGAVINYVIVINTFKTPSFELRFDLLKKSILSQIKYNAKAVFLCIAVGDERAAEFTLRGGFDPQAEVVNIRWAVDIKNGNFICGKDSPSKFDGIENILKNAKEPQPKTVSGIFRSQSCRSSDFIKTRSVIVTYGLIALNVIMFILLSLDGGSENTQTLLKYGAIYAPYIKQGEYYRLFTYTFLHIGILHIFSNMFGLFIFGSRCERYYGYLKFTAVYLISGLGCSLLSFLFSGESVSAGASGAIFGIMGSSLAYTLINNIKMDGLDAYVYIIISIINIGFGFVYPGVDNWGHIGGFAAGVILGIIIGFADKKKVSKNDKAV